MFKKLVLVTALLSSLSVFAASDGNLGPTSTGSTDISIIKPAAVQISNVDDLVFGEHPFIPDGSVLEMFDSVCVFSSTSLYSISIESPSTSTDFELVGEITNVPLPIEFLWSVNGSMVGSYSPTSFYGNIGDPISPNCYSSTNATIGARIQSADYNIVPADTYSGTVMLVVSPE